MSETTQLLLGFGGALFAMGMVGFLTRRSMILMFLSLEMMLAGVSMNLVAFSKFHQNYQGQIMAMMILAVAACEAAIALALVVSLFRRKATLDVFAWSELNETPTTKMMDPIEPIVEPETEYPKLTPAGLDPGLNPIPSKMDKDGWVRPDPKPAVVKEIEQNA